MGHCTFGESRRSTPASIAAWPAARQEPPLALSLWRSEVGPHKAYTSLKMYTMETSLFTLLALSTAGPLFSEAPVDVTANIGENVTLPCTARGSPQPTVTWRRQDGRQIFTRTDSQRRTMLLDNGHLLIQGEVPVKHYQGGELWCVTQANTASWLP